MTFIASVIAKEGVAVIADSLVTSMRPVLEFNDFINYIDQKLNNGQPVKIDPGEVFKLFEIKPSHTKDYEDKLFQYGKYGAITTAGNASINGQRIKKLVQKAHKVLKPSDRGDLASIEKKVKDLTGFVTDEVKVFLSKNNSISTTVLLYTTYSRLLNKVFVYKINVNATKDSALDDPDYEFVTVSLESNSMSVVCEGQNRQSERLLLGDFNVLFEKLPYIVKRVAKDFNIPEERITNEYLSDLLHDNTIMTQESINDIKMFRLRDLSLQQAVDLANLLMRIEIDIQKYTENIPSVGGVIKLAVIDNDGFRFISGNEIVTHEPFLK